MERIAPNKRINLGSAHSWVRASWQPQPFGKARLAFEAAREGGVGPSGVVECL